MSFVIAGLGNPKEEYENTRHNTGRIVLDNIRKEFDGSDFVFDKKLNALVSEMKIGKKNKIKLVCPETFMNKSGLAIAKIVKSVKSGEKLIVIYDDFQLPLGRMKISFNRSSGGHNGLGSIIKSLKTEAFIRIRIGIASPDTKGNAKVPHGDERIEKFILGRYKDEEMKTLKKISKSAAEAVSMIVAEGREKAMSVFNSK